MQTPAFVNLSICLKTHSLPSLGWYGVLAFELGWIVAAGSLLGYYADQYLGTSPWLTAIEQWECCECAVSLDCRTEPYVPEGTYDDRED
jgi:hypothetical protein